MFKELESKRKYEKIDGKEIIIKRLKCLMKKNNEEAIVLRQSLAEVRNIEQNGSSDFMNLFRAQIYSEIKCKGGCNSEETCFEDRIMMELDIPKGRINSDLMEWFERTFEEVYYDEENENHWDKWDKITIFTRKEWISRLPKIMIIHLKRFKTNAYGEQQRNNMNIEFPIKNLDVSPIVHDYFKESNPNFKYHLHGVSIHRGTIHGGHYTANIKNMSGDMKWYEWDDNSTRIIDEPESYGAGPYVLFYHRNDVANMLDNNLN